MYLGETTFQIDGGMSRLSSEWALDYADYALALAKLEGRTNREFTPGTASSLIYALRRGKQFGKALKDYSDLWDRGVRYCWADNQAALCAFEMPNRRGEIALEASERAIVLNDNSPVLFANSGYFHYYLNDAQEAYRRFRKVLEVNPEHEFSNPYLYPVAEAMYKAYTEGIYDLDKQWLRTLLDRAMSEAMEKKHYSSFVSFSQAARSLDSD